MDQTDPKTIVLTDPRPLPKDGRCPRCGAGKDKRVASGHFGAPHDVCRNCGHEFAELTV